MCSLHINASWLVVLSKIAKLSFLRWSNNLVCIVWWLSKIFYSVSVSTADRHCFYGSLSSMFFFNIRMAPFIYFALHFKKATCQQSTRQMSGLWTPIRPCSHLRPHVLRFLSKASRSTFVFVRLRLQCALFRTNRPCRSGISNERKKRCARVVISFTPWYFCASTSYLVAPKSVPVIPSVL